MTRLEFRTIVPMYVRMFGTIGADLRAAIDAGDEGQKHALLVMLEDTSIEAHKMLVKYFGDWDAPPPRYHLGANEGELTPFAVPLGGTWPQHLNDPSRILGDMRGLIKLQTGEENAVREAFPVGASDVVDAFRTRDRLALNRKIWMGKGRILFLDPPFWTEAHEQEFSPFLSHHP